MLRKVKDYASRKRKVELEERCNEDKRPKYILAETILMFVFHVYFFISLWILPGRIQPNSCCFVYFTDRLR